MSQLRHLPRDDVPLPLLLQRPGHGAGAEVGHVLVLRQPVDGLLQDLGIFAENRAVAGQQDTPRRRRGCGVSDCDEARQVRAVVGVDGADAAVLVDVVAAEEQVAELEAELARRVAGRVPDLQLELADLDLVALVRASRRSCTAASGCRSPGP